MIIDLRDIYKDYNQGNMPVPVLKDVVKAQIKHNRLCIPEFSAYAERKLTG